MRSHSGHTVGPKEILRSHTLKLLEILCVHSIGDAYTRHIVWYTKIILFRCLSIERKIFDYFTFGENYCVCVLFHCIACKLANTL